jgi:hypothetical protein
LDRAKEKRNLEKLVIHKNQFKGKQDEVGNVDIAEILEEEVLAIGGKSVEVEKGVLSDEELRMIMDRSEEAYEIKNDGKRFDLMEEAVNLNIF